MKQTMKACVLEGIGDLRLEDVDMPQPAEDEVLLRVCACGICSSDIPRIYKTGTYHFPTIPGHEFAGEIVAAGSAEYEHLIGRRASVFPLKPCFKCPSCMEGAYARCDSYDYYGSRCNGAYARYLAVKVWNLVFYEGIADEQAALCEPAAVALHALQRAGVYGSETAESKRILIVGTGTIGLLTALWAQGFKASQVIIAGRSQDKLQLAGDIVKGADAIDSTAPDYEEQLLAMTQGHMADIVIECVGSDAALAAAVRSAAKGGTLVLMGNPDGDMTLPKVVYWQILRRELTVKGTWNSEYSDSNNNWKQVIEAIKKGILSTEGLITHSFPLEEYESALDTVRDRSAGSIKVMLRPNADNVSG